MLLVEGNTLFDAYTELNELFLREGEDLPDRRIVWGMGHLPKLTTPLITLVGRAGWGLPGPKHPYHDMRRLKSLDHRYTHPEFWEFSMKGFTEASHKKALFKPRWRNFNFPLYRDPARTRVPVGGGCLLGFSMTFTRNSIIVDVASRSSEITKALYGDMQYLEMLVHRAFTEAEVKIPKTQLPIVTIRWSISLGYQRSLYVPLFILYERGGPSAAREWMAKAGRSDWENRCRRFSKVFMMNRLYPKVGSDKRWSNLYADMIESTGKWRGKQQAGRFKERNERLDK